MWHVLQCMKKNAFAPFIHVSKHWCLNDDSERRKYQNSICKESISFVCQKERAQVKCFNHIECGAFHWCSFDIDNVNAVPLVLLLLLLRLPLPKKADFKRKDIEDGLFCSMLFWNSKCFSSLVFIELWNYSIVHESKHSNERESGWALKKKTTLNSLFAIIKHIFRSPALSYTHAKLRKYQPFVRHRFFDMA